MIGHLQILSTGQELRVRGTNKEREQMLGKAKFNHAVNGKWAGKGMAAATLGIKVR